MNGLTAQEMKQLRDLVNKTSMSDLQSLVGVFNARQSALASLATARFSTGDRVSFDAKGRRVTGVITKVNRKTVAVKADDGRNWKVVSNLLQPLVHDS